MLPLFSGPVAGSERAPDARWVACASAVAVLALGAVVSPGISAPPDRPDRQDEGTSFWTTHVAPLLRENCVRCHGGARTRNDLDLSRPARILFGGERGPAVVPGDPASSLLYRLIQPGGEPHMPPGQDQLEPAAMDILRTWIEGLDEVPPAPRGGSGRARREDPGPSMPPADLRPELVIDFLVESKWRELGVIGASLCDDSTFIRRLHLDLLGRIPSTGERRDFLRDTHSDKRSRLVDRLLRSPEHARYLREIFDVVLMGRGPPEVIEARRTSGWHAWLERVFAENRPWDDILRGILVARPPSQDEAGAIWFLYERRDRHQAIAESIAPAVFGIQIQCAQCHDHPVAPEIEQRHYWGLVSFFNRSTNAETSAGPRIDESAIGGFVEFTTLAGESQPAGLTFFRSPTVPEARSVGGEGEGDLAELYEVPPPPEGAPRPTAVVPRFSRREAFFREVVREHPLVSRAIVNRLWAHFLGRGLVHPVDSMDSAHPPSHPNLLAWLAGDFRRNGYDIRRLIRGLVLSRTYQLDGLPGDGDATARPETFARGLEIPLPAEALWRSILVATGNYPLAGAVDDTGEELRRRLTEVFPDLFPETIVSGLSQALFLSNNPTLDALLEPREGTTTGRLLGIGDIRQRAATAIEWILGRPGTNGEIARAASFLRSRQDRPADGVKQLVWALVASAEFRFRP